MSDISTFLLPYLEAAFYVIIFIAPAINVVLIADHINHNHSKKWNKAVLIANWVVGGGLTYLATGHWVVPLAICSLGIVFTNSARKSLPQYYISGQLFVVTAIMGALLGTIWGIMFVLSQEVSSLIRLFMVVNFLFLSSIGYVGLATLLPFYSYLFRKTWLRPSTIQPSIIRSSFPFVSIHVPCHAEPPDIVCNTLDCLAKINYPNFEIIIIDNNTPDEKLWKPVQEHCERLGQKFIFFHKENMQGAKAGALNFALEQTNKQAEIIGILDADYCADPSFLMKLFSYFDDPSVGFIQTPHDYRVEKNNHFQKACYWEYIPAYRLKIAALNEWMSSYIIGTMCLIRKSALQKSGGWSEWCLTEDAECGLRIHANGYSSIYVRETMGKGLIPESFLDYKKQRLRWTIGPIQQLKKHWRWFLPFGWAKPSQLSSAQRLLELSHGLRETSPILFAIALIQSAILAYILMEKGETIPIPTLVWSGIAISSISLGVLKWLTYRLAHCHNLIDMLWGEVATFSLMHTRLVGALKGIFGSGEIEWTRTNKFKLKFNPLRALSSVYVETAVGSILLLTSYLLWLQSSEQHADFMLLASLGYLISGLIYFSSLLMAIMGEWQLHAQKIHTNDITNTSQHQQD